jgi:hypothetical protein
MSIRRTVKAICSMRRHWWSTEMEDSSGSVGIDCNPVEFGTSETNSCGGGLHQVFMLA